MMCQISAYIHILINFTQNKNTSDDTANSITLSVYCLTG